MTSTDNTRLLTIRQAADRLAVSVSTLRRLAIQYHLVRRCRRYSEPDIAAYIATTRRAIA